MKKAKGFTLIELLIVVAIIAILALIAVPNFLEAQVRSKVSRCKADMRTTATALESYGVDHNGYPPEWDYGHPLGTWGTVNEPPFHTRIPSHLTSPVPYITSIPKDPFISFEMFLDWAPKHVSERYVYYNYKYYFAYWWPSSPPNPNAAGYHRYEDAGEWLFYSPGPDRDWYNQPAASVYINYDATNGTVSLGNIFRTQKTNDSYKRGDW